MSTEESMVLFVAGVILGIFISGALFNLYGYNEADKVQQQAVERGYAIHCPKDGKFAWRGECNERWK